jgi:uncharacterized protein YqhQ
VSEQETIAAPSSNGAGRPRLRLGGMALRNGLLIHGPTSWAAAARAPDGEIAVASGPKPSFAPGATAAVPLLRGPLRLAEAFAVIPLVRRRLPASRLPFEDPRVIATAVVASLLGGMLRRGRPATLARETIANAIGVLPALVALSDSNLAAYHGVEHKAIGAYEQGEPDPATVPKEHERCGSHLVTPLLVLSIAGQLIVDRLFESPGRLTRAVAAVGGASIAVELFAWSERHPKTSAAHAFRWPGFEIQRLVATREPTPEQLEVGSAALSEILRAEGATS